MTLPHINLTVTGRTFAGRVVPRNEFAVAVIDANNFCQRVFGVPAIPATYQGYLGAVVGMLCNLMSNENFDVAYLVFDAGRDWRNKIFQEGEWFGKNGVKGYKGTRPLRDKELRELQTRVIDDFFNIAQDLGIPVIDLPGVEADDIIYSICKELKLGVKVVVSADEDLMQCIQAPATMWYAPLKNMFLDGGSFEYLNGFKPHHLATLKAMLGDTSDNIEGIYGLAKKTLLAMYARSENFPWKFFDWLKAYGTPEEKSKWLNDRVIHNYLVCKDLVDLNLYAGYLPTPSTITRQIRKPKNPDYSVIKDALISSNKTLGEVQKVFGINRVIDRLHKNLLEFSTEYKKLEEKSVKA